MPAQLPSIAAGGVPSAGLPVDRWPGAGAGLGVLTCEITPGLVDEVIELAGCREKRRRLLPARTVVYFVLGLCLFSGADSVSPPGYRSVMRWLTNGLRPLHETRLPTSPALTRARQRLGSKPLELLFDRCRGPLASAATPGASAFGLRLVAWDGTDLDVAATAPNLAAFGLAAQAGNPQLRLMALIECGTHALLDAAFDGAARASEQALARRLLHALRPGMLLLADRNFPGYDLWELATATGAHLAWRMKKNRVFPPLATLPDGSFLSIMPTPAESRRQARARHDGRPLPPGPPQGHLVRIVEYTVTINHADGATTTQSYRLATTLLDPRHAPATRLAALYHQRWESETSYAELKTRLRGAGFILRSKSPDLACQELLAFLTVYQALRALQARAAHQAGLDPRRISFTTAIRIARDHASGHTPATPLTHARRRAITDLLADLLPPRRNRRYPRTKKPAKNTFPASTQNHPRPPSQVSYHITITPEHPPPPQPP